MIACRKAHASNVRRQGRIVIGLLTIGLVVGLISPPAFARPQSSSCEGITDRGRGWTTIETPDFPTGPLGDGQSGKYTSLFTVDPSDPDRIFASSANAIQMSTDGGCSWKEVLSLTDISTPPLVPCDAASVSGEDGNQTGGGSPGCDYIYSIDVAGDGAIFIQVGSGLYQGLRTSVFVSRDDGETWEFIHDPATPDAAYGQGDLAISATDPKIVYLARSDQWASAVVNDGFFASEDGGKTWSRRVAPGTQSRIWVDPLDPKTVWAVTLPALNLYPGGVQMSTNGGQAWSEIGGPFAGYIQDASVSHSPGHPTSLALMNAGKIFLSSDAGDSWSELPTDGPASGWVEFGRTASDFIYAEWYTPGEVWRYNLRRSSLSSLKDEQWYENDYQMTPIHTTGGFYFLGNCPGPDPRNCGVIERFSGRGA